MYCSSTNVYAYSSNEDGSIPDLLYQENYEHNEDEEIRKVSSNEELARIVDADKIQTDDPLDYREIPTVDEILTSTR